jgi:hypothetical protein
MPTFYKAFKEVGIVPISKFFTDGKSAQERRKTKVFEKFIDGDLAFAFLGALCVFVVQPVFVAGFKLCLMGVYHFSWI